MVRRVLEVLDLQLDGDRRHLPDVRPPPVAAPERPVDADTVDLHELAGEKAKVPWHFKLMVVALVIYLGWRFVQLIGIVI